MAYADLGCYGNNRARTPNLDRMASEGIRFTDFYVGQPVCSASRAALLTGCYPGRVGVQGAFGPNSRTALHTNEVTIAEMLKPRGYTTAIYGKWHLGHTPEFLPTRQGFDDYFGLPYSNDMWPFHPVNPTNYPPLPLIEGERIVQYMPDQTQLTTWYTERAVKFIERNKDRPFFLYVPHNMPHVPLHVSAKYKDKSGAGLYGDVIMEIDWSVGEILAALKRSGLDDRTLVLFSSDNGPWLEYGNHAGNAGPLREGKMTSFEGGFRVPFLARWPGHIPTNRVSRELVTAMDVLPALASLTGAELPKSRIDGKDISPLLIGTPGARSPHDAFFYYCEEQLQAVRSGKWKLHLPHEYIHIDPPGADAKPGKVGKQQIGLALFDLDQDLGETNDVAEKYPTIVARLQGLAEQCRDDLGDSLQKRVGRNVRPAGIVASAVEKDKAANPNPTARLVTPEPDGSIVLHARHAYPHGQAIRYEPQPNKNTIGYWTRKDDWVSWDFKVPTNGTYKVEILQGCGKGSGGSKVQFSVAEQRLEVIVEDTGGFQNFIVRNIGELKLEKPGNYTLSVKPITKPGLAVMDLRSVTLTPTR